MALSRKFSLGAIFDFVNKGTPGLRSAVGETEKLRESIADVIAGTNVLGVSAPQAIAAGLAIAGAGAAGLFAIKKLGDAALELEAGIAQVTTLLDGEGKAVLSTSEQLRVITGLSVKYGKGSEELAKALFQTVSASVEASQAADVLEVATRAAVAGNADLFATVDGLTSVMNAYGNEALGVATQTEAATKVADIFFQTNRLGKTTVEELSRSLGSVVPTSAAVGVSFEEIGAALATMTAQGLNTRRSTMFLNQALANILKPTEQAVKVADRLGVEFTASALASQGFVGFLSGLKNAVGDNQEAMSTLFGSVEAFKAVTVLTSKEGGPKFVAALKAMGAAAGSVDKALEVVGETATQQIARMTEGFASLAKGIGFATLPLRAAFARAVADVLESMIAFANAHPGVVRGALAIAAAISVAAIAIGGLVVAVGAVAIATAVWPVIAAAVGAAAGAVLGFLWPVGLAVAGLTAGALLLAFAWDDLVAGFKSGLVAIDPTPFETLREVWEQLKIAGKALFGDLFPEFGKAGDEADGVFAALGVTMGVVANIVISFITALVFGLTKLFEAIKFAQGFVGNLGEGESATFGGFFSGLGDALAGGGPGAMDRIASAATLSVPAVPAAVGGPGAASAGQQTINVGGVPVQINLQMDGQAVGEAQVRIQLEQAERVGEVSPEARQGVASGLPLVQSP